MYKIQIVLTYRNNFIYRIARRLGITWTHAAIRYSIRGDDPEDWKVFETAGFGTVHRSWDDFIEGVDEYALLETKIPLRFNQRIALMSFAWGNVGKFYNFPRLIWLAIKILLGQRKPQALYYRSHVCSSFVNTCYDHIGIELAPGLWVLPDDIYWSDKLRRVTDD